MVCVASALCAVCVAPSRSTACAARRSARTPYTAQPRPKAAPSTYETLWIQRTTVSAYVLYDTIRHVPAGQPSAHAHARMHAGAQLLLPVEWIGRVCVCRRHDRIDDFCLPIRDGAPTSTIHTIQQTSETEYARRRKAQERGCATVPQGVPIVSQLYDAPLCTAPRP